MPRTPKRNLIESLHAASERLHEAGSPDLAEVVAQVAGPSGWMRLRDAKAEAGGGTPDNFQMRVEATVSKELHAAAKAAGRYLTEDVNEAFQALIDGRYTPAARPPVRRDGTKRVGVNVRPETTLREQAKAIVPERDLPHAAADYLMRKYKVGPYAPGYRGALRARGDERLPRINRAVRDAIRAAADQAGRQVTDDVDDGFEAFLAGEFTPDKAVWTAVTGSDLAPLKIRPDNDLHDRVKQAGQDRTHELGWTPRPAQVAIAYLVQKYRIDLGSLAG